MSPMARRTPKAVPALLPDDMLSECSDDVSSAVDVTCARATEEVAAVVETTKVVDWTLAVEEVS